MNFNEKSEKTNYSTLNACGLAIFSNFYLHWLFSNLSFFEQDPHMDSPEGIRVKAKLIFVNIFEIYLVRQSLYLV